MAPGLPNRSVILCILKWNQQGTLRALEGRWGLRALENCRYCPSGHKGWYPWLSGARCVSVLGLFFPGKSLPSFVYRVSPHSLVWRCLFFLIFEELSKGEHRYRSQPDRLCVVVSPPPPWIQRICGLLLMLLLNDLEMRVPKTRESLASLGDWSIVILFNFENVLCVWVHECVGMGM